MLTPSSLLSGHSYPPRAQFPKFEAPKQIWSKAKVTTVGTYLASLEEEVAFQEGAFPLEFLGQEGSPLEDP